MPDQTPPSSPSRSSRIGSRLNSIAVRRRGSQRRSAWRFLLEQTGGMMQRTPFCGCARQRQPGSQCSCESVTQDSAGLGRASES